jgi:nicotinamide-nucleotide amidase
VSLFPADLITAAEAVLAGARAKGWRIATAESCTGGLVAALLTEIAGSSDVFDRGFVTYSNHAKVDLLGVPKPLLRAHGAVSAETAQAMAAGAVERARVDLSVAITGVAGPGGGTDEKPVGLVHFATSARGEVIHREMRFGDLGRSEVRLAALRTALQLLAERL